MPNNLSLAIIYSDLIAAYMKSFQSVASAPETAVQTLYQSNDLPAERYRP
jgi:hypothetical protein